MKSYGRLHALRATHIANKTIKIQITINTIEIFFRFLLRLLLLLLRLPLL